MYLDCQNIKIVSRISNSIIANVLEYMKKPIQDQILEKKNFLAGAQTHKSITLVEGKNSKFL